LQHENEALKNEAKALRTSNEAALHDAAEASARAEQAAGELDALRAERKQVRVRIEKLLSHIDQVSTS
jgi:chromosome segregation ATPase